MIAIWDQYLEGQLPVSRNVKGTMASELDSSKVPSYPNGNLFESCVGNGQI